MEFAPEDARSLAAKLEALELTDGERAALDAVFDAASDEDVAGFELGQSRYLITPLSWSHEVISPSSLRKRPGRAAIDEASLE